MHSAAFGVIRRAPTEQSVRHDGFSGTKPAPAYAGATCTHTLPATATGVNNRDLAVAAVRVIDAPGHKSVEYVDVNLAARPSKEGKIRQ